MQNYKVMSISQDEINRAVSCLENGQLVAFPTETVYGLGVDASNREAVKRLYHIKGRPEDHPSIVHLASLEQIYDWASEVPELALKLAKNFWPGPMTLILPRQKHVMNEITGGQDTVGIRIPSHPVAQALLKAFGRGVVAPSANRFGKISPTTAQHVHDDLGDDVAMVLDGGSCPVGVESTIVEFSSVTPKILRPGMLTSSIIGGYLGIPIHTGSGIKAPGTLSRHYSPTALSVTMNYADLLREHQENPATLAIMSTSPDPCPRDGHTWIKMPNQPSSYAQKLYAWLRYLDAMRPSKIIVQTVPNEPDWEAITDRIRRATCPR